MNKPLLTIDQFQKRDQQIRQQQTIVETHVKRIAELEAEVTSLQVRRDYGNLRLSFLTK